MGRVVVVAENPGLLRGVIGFAINVRSGIDGGLVAVSFGGSAEEVSAIVGGLADEAYLVKGSGYLPRLITEALRKIAGGFSLVIGPTTRNMTDALAYFSASVDTPMISEVLDLRVAGDGEAEVERPVLAGRAIGRYRVRLPLVVTTQPGRVEPPRPSGTTQVHELTITPDEGVRVVRRVGKGVGAVDISTAEVVVGVGRGFRREEDLGMAFELAKLLGGEVGCSRPIAADYGWLPEDRWIGISAKRIRPKLYLAIGISGAPQHVSGVLDSKVIVAVNKDKNAQIFQYCDYGVVADLYQFIPALIKKLKALA